MLKDIDPVSKLSFVSMLSDQTMIKGEVKVPKYEAEECSIAELVQMSTLMDCSGRNYQMSVVIVKVLYYWVDNSSSERLQAIISDSTGIHSTI